MTKQARRTNTGGPTRVGLSIAAVERDSGLSKDTLRAWEKRYGFPAPLRDARDERVYPVEQVAQLREVKRLIDQGHRPGKVLRMPRDDLQALARSTDGAARRAEASLPPELQVGLDLVVGHRALELQPWLSRALAHRGLARFVLEVAAPLTEAVGDAWARGQLQVFEEHLYTEAIQLVLRNAIQSLPAAGRPHVLLTTLPAEPHGLGLLMAQALLALEGARATSLGLQTPLLDVVNAAQAHRPQIVALSFSSLQNGRSVVDALAQLRAGLPPSIAIWAGGRCSALHRQPIAGVTALRELADIGPALAAWRREHAPR